MRDKVVLTTVSKRSHMPMLISCINTRLKIGQIDVDCKCFHQVDENLPRWLRAYALLYSNDNNNNWDHLNSAVRMGITKNKDAVE